MDISCFYLIAQTFDDMLIGISRREGGHCKISGHFYFLFFFRLLHGHRHLGTLRAEVVGVSNSRKSGNNYQLTLLPCYSFALAVKGDELDQRRQASKKENFGPDPFTLKCFQVRMQLSRREFFFFFFAEQVKRGPSSSSLVLCYMLGSDILPCQTQHAVIRQRV